MVVCWLLCLDAFQNILVLLCDCQQITLAFLLVEATANQEGCVRQWLPKVTRIARRCSPFVGIVVEVIHLAPSAHDAGHLFQQKSVVVLDLGETLLLELEAEIVTQSGVRPQVFTATTSQTETLYCCLFFDHAFVVPGVSSS